MPAYYPFIGGQKNGYVHSAWWYGFLAGPETTKWHRVIRVWRGRADGTWVPAADFMGAGRPGDPLYMTTQHDGSDVVYFTAFWTLGLEGTFSDYEVLGWYDALTHESLGYANRVAARETSPGQLHQVYFIVRTKAVTTGPLGFHRPAGEAVQSPVLTWTDPRNQA